jgi:hypothetical protein
MNKQEIIAEIAAIYRKASPEEESSLIEGLSEMSITELLQLLESMQALIAE